MQRIKVSVSNPNIVQYKQKNQLTHQSKSSNLGRNLTVETIATDRKSANIWVGHRDFARHLSANVVLRHVEQDEPVVVIVTSVVDGRALTVATLHTVPTAVALSRKPAAFLDPVGLRGEIIAQGGCFAISRKLERCFAGSKVGVFFLRSDGLRGVDGCNLENVVAMGGEAEDGKRITWKYEGVIGFKLSGVF